MSKFMRALFLACTVVLVLPGDAAAEFNAGEFLKKYDAATGSMKAIYLQYLNGNANGISWANTAVGRNHPQAKIYCPPKKLALSAKQTVGILRRFVAKSAKFRKAPVGAAMMFALKNKWPCR